MSLLCHTEISSHMMHDAVFSLLQAVTAAAAVSPTNNPFVWRLSATNFSALKDKKEIPGSLLAVVPVLILNDP